VKTTTAFNWLRWKSNGGLLWWRWWIVGFRKREFTDKLNNYKRLKDYNVPLGTMVDYLHIFVVNLSYLGLLTYRATVYHFKLISCPAVSLTCASSTHLDYPVCFVILSLNLLVKEMQVYLSVIRKRFHPEMKGIYQLCFLLQTVHGKATKHSCIRVCLYNTKTSLLSWMQYSYTWRRL
jgi:hypothetical protein